MKKIIAIIICILLCLSCVAVGVNNQRDNSENDYSLKNYSNPIKNIATGAPSNAGTIEGVVPKEGKIKKDSQGNYYLTGNVSVLDSSDFSDVEAALCSGKTFDGKGYTVTTDVPLFTNLSNGTLKNFTVKGSIGSVSNGTAAIINEISGSVTFSNIRSSVEIVVMPSKSTVLSGFVAKISGLGGEKIVFDDCVFDGRLESRSTSKGAAAGGFIGEAEYADVEFKNCTSDGVILIGGNAGGFIAESKSYTDISFTNCVSDMDLDMSIRSQTHDVGGLVGYAKGNITADLIAVSGIMDLGANSHNATRSSGGVVGHWNSESTSNMLSIDNCNVYVSVISTRAVITGGIVGYVSSSAKSIDLNNCLFEGSIEYPVSNNNESTAGAIIGCISANVNNINLINCSNNAGISLLVKSGSFSASGMVGKIQTAGSSTTLSFDSCTNEGDIIINSYSATTSGNIWGMNAGGFVGYLNSTCNVVIKNSENNGDIATYLHNVSSVISDGISGGFIGNCTLDAALTVFDSCNSGAVTSAGRTGAPTAGGLVGYYAGTEISVTDFCNSGNITATAWGGNGHSYSEENIVAIGDKANGIEGISVSTARSARAAGIIGYSEASTFALYESCMNLGSICAENCLDSEAIAAGLCSTANGSKKFVRCLNSGSVTLLTDKEGQAASGIVGIADSSATLSFCVNIGNISSKSTSTGGIFGVVSSGASCENCINTGNITSTGETETKSVYSSLPSYCYPNLSKSKSTDVYIALILSAVSYDMNGAAKNYNEALIADYIYHIGVFTVTETVNSKNVFVSTVSRDFYDELISIVGEDNVTYKGIVAPKNYVTKLGGLTHHIFDEGYEKYKDRLSGISALYMSAERPEKNIVYDDLDADGTTYSVNIRLNPKNGEILDLSSYSATAYIKIGNSYIYSTVK